MEGLIFRSQLVKEATRFAHFLKQVFFHPIIGSDNSNIRIKIWSQLICPPGFTFRDANPLLFNNKSWHKFIGSGNHLTSEIRKGINQALFFKSIKKRQRKTQRGAGRMPIVLTYKAKLPFLCDLAFFVGK